MRLPCALLLLAACQNPTSETETQAPSTEAPAAEWPAEWPRTGVVFMPDGETDRGLGYFLSGPESDPEKAPLWYQRDFPSDAVMEKVGEAQTAERLRALDAGEPLRKAVCFPDGFR